MGTGSFEYIDIDISGNLYFDYQDSMSSVDAVQKWLDMINCIEDDHHTLLNISCADDIVSDVLSELDITVK